MPVKTSTAEMSAKSFFQKPLNLKNLPPPIKTFQQLRQNQSFSKIMSEITDHSTNQLIDDFMKDIPADLLQTPLEEDLLDFENLLSSNDPIEMPHKLINQINRPKLNTNFTILKVKHSNGIQKRKSIICPFKILPFLQLGNT